MYKKLLVVLSFSCILGIPFLSLNAAEAAPPRPPHHRVAPPPQPRHRVEPPAPPAEVTLERLRHNKRPFAPPPPPPPRPHHR